MTALQKFHNRLLLADSVEKVPLTFVRAVVT